MKLDIKSKKNLIFKIINAIVGFLFALTFFCFARTSSREIDFSLDDASIYDWSDDWLVSTGNTAGEVTSLPVQLDVDQGKVIILKKTLPSKIKKYNCIMYISKRQDILINVAGVLRTSYSDKEYRAYGKTSPEAIVLAPVYSTDADTDVTILLSSDGQYAGDIGQIYLGNEMSIIIMLIKKNIVSVALDVAIVLLSLVGLVSFFVYRKTFDNSIAFVYIFWITIMSAFWRFSRLEIRQMFVADIRHLETMGFLSLMIMPIPIVLYINKIYQNKYQVAGHAVIGISCTNFLVQVMLQRRGIYDFNEMMPISTAVLYGATLAVLACSFVEVRKRNYYGTLFAFASLLALFVAVNLDAVSGMSFNNSISFVVSMAILLFQLLSFTYLFVYISREHQRKKEAENASAAKSIFLATMSHEIRTPINAVLGMNEMIKRESSEAQIRDYSDNIAMAGKSLLALVNDVLDFSKIESGKMDIVDTEYKMKALLGNLLILLKGRMSSKNLKLELDIDESIPSVCMGDDVRLRQILTNILTNAVKYTNEGSIKLTVKKVDIENDEVKLMFSVKDTGIGLKSEDIDKLMNSSFIRVDKVRNRNIEGTGLGISITRRLLELMGSRLEVDSVYGEGSDFRFTISQKVVDATPMGALDGGNGKASEGESVSFFEAKGAKILAVDDTRTNLIVIRGLLKPYKCEVTICESAAACIEKCKENEYDIIFMDHMMPEMDGIEALKVLKSEGLLPEKTRVYALTANAIAGASEMYFENGFDGYIAKPIDVKELNHCLEESLLNNN